MKTALFSLMLSISFASALYSQPPDAVHGLVLAPDGTPIPGAKVTARPDGINDAGIDAVVTRTDNSGIYHFESIPSGNYLVSAEVEGEKGTSLRATLLMKFSTFDDLFYLNREGRTNASQPRVLVEPVIVEPARVTIPGPDAEVNIVIVKSAVSVSGRLAILPRVASPSLLRVALSTTTLDLAASADVHSDGTFEIGNVVPGSYMLRVIPNLGIQPEPITVKDQSLINIELGGQISGFRVSGKVPGVDRVAAPVSFPQYVYLVAQNIAAVKSSSTMINTSTSGLFRSVSMPQKLGINEAGEELDLPMAPVTADGQFEYLMIPPGVYSLRTIPDTGMANSRIIVKDMDTSGVQAGVSVRVRGEVVPTNLGTRTPEVIRLTSVGPDGPSVSASINEFGSFEFANVGPGKYRVLLDGRNRPTPSEITVDERDTIIRVESPFGSWIRGRVMFAANNPPPETIASIHVAMTNGYQSTVNPDGTFRLPSNDGEYDFFAKDLPDRYVVKSALYGTENLLNVPVKVDASVPEREILLTLEYRPGASP